MIKQAHIQWTDGSPVSTEFDDVYFSKASGIDETRYVFLEQNKLAQRWQQLNSNTFTIAETGFGTGLNFLCAWQLWQASSKPHQTLHFVSVEKFPLDHDSLHQALQQWPKLKNCSEALLSVYPPLVSGWHRIDLPKLSEESGNLCLHLFFGDVDEWLSNMEGQIDAWFLDGFAPSKNPEMWSPHLFRTMARLSHGQTTAATFTAAGLVKRGLNGMGFVTKKVKGFGKKREMLTAHYIQSQGPVAPEWTIEKPWNVYSQPKKLGHAIIVGAGIAGCSSAYSLAKRGWQVTLIDKEASIAQGASGNAQGVLYAKLSTDMNIQSEFYLSGYLYSLQLLKHTMPEKTDWNDCGVLQLAFNEKERRRQQQFCEDSQLEEVIEWVNAKLASKIANTQLEQGGLFFKGGAWVHPAAWCQALLNHKNISVINEHKVCQLEKKTDKWQVQIESIQNPASETLDGDIVILCSAHETQLFEQLQFLPTQPIAGQVSQIANVDSGLKTALCGDSYVTPTYKQNLNFGATYRLKSSNTEVTAEDHQFNLEKLKKNFPSILQESPKEIEGRTSVRCSTPDYIPIAGPICESQSFIKQFANLKKNKNWRFFEKAPYMEGLYLNIGHGSRGLSSAPLCSEMLAAHINGEILPMCKRHKEILNPNRFLVIQATKNK